MRFDQVRREKAGQPIIISVAPSQHTVIPESPAPPRKLRSKPRFSKLTVWLSVGMLVVIVVAVGVTILMTRSSDPIPASIRQQTTFPLYYPVSMSSGYTYQKESARVDNGILFYNLEGDTGTISVSEQTAPPNPPNLSMLSGFASLKTAAGNAAVGTSSTKQPIAFIISNTTMITMTGQSNTPSDIVTQLAQNMRSLPPQ